MSFTCLYLNASMFELCTFVTAEDVQMHHWNIYAHGLQYWYMYLIRSYGFEELKTESKI